MAIKRAKPVDRLYDEVREYDLVLVPDPPLASALNRRLEQAHFGPFAITPRRLAAGQREPAEDRVAFLQVIQETELSWKEAAHAIGNVLQCWDNTGELEAILEYDAFATPETEAVLDVMRNLDTTSRRLAEYDIETDFSLHGTGSPDVAVVGIEEFTALERSILPDEFDDIDAFLDEPFDRPPFRLFDSPAAIVDTILDSVDEEDADQVAIVLDQGSEFSPLVEAALEAADLPFHGGPGFNDDPDHRAFLRLLRAAHSGSGLRVADVRPVLERLRADVDVEHDEKRLHALDRPEVEWLQEFCADVEAKSFEEAIEKFEEQAAVDLEPFGEELGRLGLLEAPVTESNVGRLAFYLDSYEVPVDRHNEGVLLADATGRSASVDRPAVFYLGMDEGWTHSSPRRPWVDRDEEFTRHLQQFQRLLQNGVEQYYLVVDERGGRPVTPCLYFEELLDEDFEQFSDLEGAEPHARTYQATRDGFEHEPIGVEPDEVESLSQSGLNRLVNCPRDHLFGRLVDGPDKDYFAVGNLFHDFAEVYVNHPDEIGEAELESVLELMLETTAPFDRAVDRATNETRYRLGLETIVAFLDANPPEGAQFLSGSRGWWTNDVADHLGLDVDAPYTEWWFNDRELGLKGKIDLVHSPTELLDYKSGKRYSASQVVGQSALDPPHDTPNFQAMLYLAYLRELNPGEALSFTFFHFLETLDDLVAGEADLTECLTTVHYRPVPFEAYIARESAFEELREEGSGDCRKTLEQIEYGTYAEVLGAHPFPDGSTKAEVMDSELGEALHHRLSAAVGEYNYVENGCAQALSYLADLRDSNYFADDLDAFEAFVDERLAELNRYRSGEERFPVEGLGGEPTWRRVDHRDMILEADD